jgi:hypothetical protein
VSEVPDLLTVEEAARYLRIGRTKAYAMAKQWRDTGGQTGLPVIDLENALRVPRDELEQVIGTKLTVPLAEALHRAPLPAMTAAASSTSDEHTSMSPAVQPTARRTRARQARARQAGPSSQPALFDVPDPAA